MLSGIAYEMPANTECNYVCFHVHSYYIWRKWEGRPNYFTQGCK